MFVYRKSHDRRSTVLIHPTALITKETFFQLSQRAGSRLREQVKENYVSWKKEAWVSNFKVDALLCQNLPSVREKVLSDLSEDWIISRGMLSPTGNVGYTFSAKCGESPSWAEELNEHERVAGRINEEDKLEKYIDQAIKKGWDPPSCSSTVTIHRATHDQHIADSVMSIYEDAWNIELLGFGGQSRSHYLFTQRRQKEEDDE